MTPRERGQLGEEAAADYLVHNGYAVFARNYKVPGGELDIIALYGAYIVFVEVKTRALGSAYPGMEAVDRRKRNRLTAAAERFLYENRTNAHIAALSVRFDAIDIEVRGHTVVSLVHYEHIDL